MHDLLFGSQDQWSGQANAVETFKKLAGDLDLDQARFNACLDGGDYAQRIATDLQEGNADGVSGTPAFRINGMPVSGARPFATFQRTIDYFLAGGKPPTLEVAADSFRSRGRADAPVVITEFSDFQCPACGYVAREVIPQLIERYVDTGKVRFVYREFPLESLHPLAQKASEAAVCAGAQDKYWEMNERLFAKQEEWSAEGVTPTDLFKRYAKELGLDVSAFNRCLDSGQAAIAVQEDQMAGQMAGVQATPTFFVNDLPVEGGLPIESFGLVIDYVAAGGPRPEIIPEPGDPHLRGNPQSARAIAVAFVDYASAASAQHAREVLPELVKTYIDTGQLIYILHPWSEGADSPSAQAAAAAECAGQQGKFWEMHDQLFAQQDTWLKAANPQDSFADYAASLQLDADQFAECLGSDWARLRVQAGRVVGALYGVPSAPAFLFNNGQGQEGSPTLDEFKAVIDSILNQ